MTKISYFCGMKERINWIDWIKAWCMTIVVFCHLPQQGDTFYLQYLSSVILSSFFFISGYLKKPLTSLKESLNKYSYSLFIPYIIYNVLYFPYWLAKYYIEHGCISFTDSMKPLIGTLLLQLNSPLSCELNGVTWFLPALFLMHLVTDVCNRLKHGKSVMLLLTIISIVLYGSNKYYHNVPFITYNGFVRCLCFFFMGNLLRQTGYLKSPHLHKDLLTGGSTLLLSIALFFWHISEGNFIIHISLYYVVNFFSVVGIICICRSLNNIRFQYLTIISIGTMLIFGTHRIIIGLIDYAFEKMFRISDVYYSLPKAIILTIGIELMLVPAILFCKKQWPIMLGRKRKTNQNLVVTK